MTGERPLMPDDVPSSEGHSLKAWGDAIAAATPVPGGGSAAAICGALAASLVAMVARLSDGTSDAANEDAPGIAEEADRLREDLTLLAEEDVMAYAGVARAREMPAEEHDEAGLRRVNLNAALAGAAEVQIAVLRLAHRVLDLATAASRSPAPGTIPDARAAAVLASAAARVAWENVRADLALIHEDPDLGPGDYNPEKVTGLLRQARSLLNGVLAAEAELQRTD